MTICKVFTDTHRASKDCSLKSTSAQEVDLGEPLELPRVWAVGHVSWFFEILDVVQRALYIGLSANMDTVRTPLCITYDMILPVPTHILSAWPDRVTFIDF